MIIVHDQSLSVLVEGLQMPQVAGLDHLVLTVADIDRTIVFYRDVLGMVAEPFHPADGSTRWALKFGAQKINLHAADAPFAPRAAVPMPGSADLCFLTDTGLEEWQAHLAACRGVIEQGPVARTGAVGPIMSIYLRDPDGNLIELANLV
jgi:catechol 2,3-dioxygenase-like lactoylglutathione lyase family enzyme